MSYISTTNNTASLESTYRLALRVYPSRWRAQHGDELIGVMLDVAAHQGKTKASVPELLHLGVHGVTARVNQADSVIPRCTRDHLAAVGLIAGTALAVVMMVLGELGRWFHQDSYTFTDEPFGPLTTPAALAFLLTLTAFATQALSRTALARSLHAINITACTVLGILMKTTEPTIVVPSSVFIYFAITSFLALLGNPTRTPRLRRLFLLGAPILGGFLVLTSHLQSSGSAKTFWRPHEDTMILDGYALSVAGGKLVLIASLITLTGAKTRPWACLLLIPLTAPPLTSLFLMIGGNPTIGLVGIPFDVFYTICTLAAVVSAWIAWKQHTITFPTTAGAPTKA